MTDVGRDLIEHRLDELFADIFRLSDPEVRAIRMIWEAEDESARKLAFERARAAIRLRKREDMVNEAQSTIRRWLGNYLTATTAEYGAFLTGPGNGMDAGEVRRGTIPPLMDAVVAIVGADGLDPQQRELLLDPVTQVVGQHGRPVA